MTKLVLFMPMMSLGAKMKSLGVKITLCYPRVEPCIIKCHVTQIFCRQYLIVGRPRKFWKAEADAHWLWIQQLQLQVLLIVYQFQCHFIIVIQCKYKLKQHTKQKAPTPERKLFAPEASQHRSFHSTQLEQTLTSSLPLPLGCQDGSPDMSTDCQRIAQVPK